MSPLDTRRKVAGAMLRLQPDFRLTALAREGHEAALEEIVRRYRGPLVGYAAAIVSFDRAEDVVQDSLVKAMRALATSDAEIALRPWLYTIVRNTALNELRDSPVHAGLDETIDGVPQPPDVAAGRERLAGLVAGLQALPDQQRDALVQREFEGRSHEEIAASMGASPGAVRGLIFRARAALRHAAGVLVPAPLLRQLLSGEAAAAGAAVGGAAIASGGGAALALKAGVALVAGVLAVGSGVTLREQDGNVGTARADGAGVADERGGEPAPAGPSPAGPGGAGGEREGDDDVEDDSSGPGGGDDGGDGHGESGEGAGGDSGSGGGDSGSGDDGDSGPGGGGDPEADGGGGSSSGPGSGDEPEDDRSGSSGSGSGDDAELDGGGDDLPDADDLDDLDDLD